jgi:hypothetical protein
VTPSGRTARDEAAAALEGIGGHLGDSIKSSKDTGVEHGGVAHLGGFFGRDDRRKAATTVKGGWSDPVRTHPCTGRNWTRNELCRCRIPAEARSTS